MPPKVVMWKGDVMVWWWRMHVPSEHLNRRGWDISLIEMGQGYDAMKDADVVMAQRIVSRQRFEILQKLKQDGKRIVFDIDDNLFEIPEDHPIYEKSKSWNMDALRGCLQIADVVTTTTEPLKRLIKSFAGVDAVVIPNALDTQDAIWPLVENAGSKDGIRRIYWQGTGTHDADWVECCLDAVDEIMIAREDVSLIIWGGVPRPLVYRAMEHFWLDRLHGLLFTAPEEYFRLVPNIISEVGLAPLRDVPFNSVKSPAKFVEYTLTGVPTVASNVGPYKDVIENEHSGILATGTSEWKAGILSLLDNDRKRKEMLYVAREIVSEKFDIRKTIENWERVFHE